jgi:hypothetical protein
MNDKKGAKGVTSTLQNWSNVQELLKLGLNNKTTIRSEIYLQIYKQISHNTNLYVSPEYRHLMLMSTKDYT